MADGGKGAKRKAKQEKAKSSPKRPSPVKKKRKNNNPAAEGQKRISDEVAMTKGEGGKTKQQGNQRDERKAPAKEGGSKSSEKTTSGRVNDLDVPLSEVTDYEIWAWRQGDEKGEGKSSEKTSSNEVDNTEMSNATEGEKQNSDAVAKAASDKNVPIGDETEKEDEIAKTDGGGAKPVKKSATATHLHPWWMGWALVDRPWDPEALLTRGREERLMTEERQPRLRRKNILVEGSQQHLRGRGAKPVKQ